MIAISIVLVAIEAVRFRRGGASLAIRWPWLVAFAFGLLHGFGFVGTLQEIGLPQGGVPMALLFCNLEVEIGQLIFIAAILALVWRIARAATIPLRAPIMAAYAIGTGSSFWLFERLDAMFF